MLKIDEPSFLIALPGLRDQTFYQSVILLIEHNKEGALGFIINKKSNVPISDLLEGPKQPQIPSTMKAWVGGPVDTETGIILKPANASDKKGFTLTSNSDVLSEMVSQSTHINASEFVNAIMYPYRFLVGYTGWGPQQLDQELRNGFWLETEVNKDILFNCPWSNIWHTCISSFGCNPESMVSVAQPFLN